MTRNAETARLLYKVGAVFRILEGDTFRTRAYFNAATAIENLSDPIEDLYSKNNLEGIPGVGENIRRYLIEYIKHGKVRHFESQFKKVPAGMFPLMDIRGVGPITAYKIAKKFHLNDASSAGEKLKKILKQGRITEIEGFKERTESKIRKALEVKAGGKQRLLLAEALPVASLFLDYLKQSPLIIEAEPLGSLRRKLPTVGDIDMAICSQKPGEAMTYALEYPEIAHVITRGDKVSHVKLRSGYEADIKNSLPNQWGSLLQHYTGSKFHNIKLRTKALGKGLSLSEYGIRKGKRLIDFSTEEDFYKFLGMTYIPPELREDHGEIEMAVDSSLPILVKESDIKGDLHIHSDFDFPSSHDIGSTTLTSILKQADDYKYEYVGISDHNPKYTDLSDKEKEKILTKRRDYLLREFQSYEKKVKKRTLKLLIGLEVDIRPDGKRALSDKLLDTLDYAIVAIHSSFNLSVKDNTLRILDALDHPKAIILGHPTGRLLNQRDSIQADWDKIFDYCKSNNKIIEINASPSRLDLPDDLIMEAGKYGVKFIINTDSHNTSQMEFMKYGVWQARRGWAGRSQIINTLSYQKLQSVLNLEK